MAKRCYRCRQKGHETSSCTMQDDTCSTCESPDHKRAECPCRDEPLRPLNLQTWKLVLQLLLCTVSFDDFVEMRRVCRLMAVLVANILQESGRQHLQSDVTTSLHKFLRDEPCFAEFKTNLGVKLLIYKLSNLTLRTPVGKLNVYKYRNKNGYKELMLLTEAEYFGKYPNETIEGYNMYCSMLRANDCDERMRFKIEVKTLKCLLKFLGIRYAQRGTDFLELPSTKSKYEFVFKDAPYMRTVDLAIWAVLESKRSGIEVVLFPDYSPVEDSLIQFG